MTAILGYDTTHSAIGYLPKGAGAYAGYTTGSSDIRWTASDWARFPGAVRIDQDWNAGDPTADVLDVETGAATPAECPAWYVSALRDFNTCARPGQRRPTLYANQSTMPLIVQHLHAAGIRSGPKLWLADITSRSAAEAMLGNTSRYGFPIVGVQFSYVNPNYDVDVFDSTWLSDVSGATDPVVVIPPVHDYLKDETTDMYYAIVPDANQIQRVYAVLPGKTGPAAFYVPTGKVEKPGVQFVTFKDETTFAEVATIVADATVSG